MVNTLGYKEAEVFKKSDIARIQLVEAINLFVRKSFICSLTLAGSSEEIFAGLLLTRGNHPVIEESVSRIMEIRKVLDFKAMGNITKSGIVKEWNNAKNRSKHHDKDEPETICFNDCDEAYWMIKRSLANAKRLGIAIENDNEFESWVVSNICL